MINSFIFSALGGFAVAMVMNAPKKTTIYTGLIAGLGYIINTYLMTVTNTTISIFGATLLIIVCSEILARIFNYPATIFIFPALTPLLPGLKLYQTIEALTNNNINQAFKLGGETVLIAMAVAMALVVTSTLTRQYQPFNKK